MSKTFKQTSVGGESGERPTVRVDKKVIETTLTSPTGNFFWLRLASAFESLAQVKHDCNSF